MNRVKLEEVCNKASSNYAQKDLDSLCGDFPVYGASGLIKCIDTYHQDKEYIAVVKDGAGIGRTMFLPARSSVIGTLQYILPKDNVLPKYLYYAVKHMHLEKYYTGSTIPHIYFKDYKKEEFNLPSRELQLEIIDILERLERIIGYQKQQLEKLDIIIKSRFVEMFGDMKLNNMGWPLCTFKDFAEIDTTMIYDFSNYRDYPHIGIDSIEKESGNILNYKTVHEDGVISGKYLFTSEHIIYSKIRPNLNKVAIPDFEGVCSADAYPILPKKGICNRIFLAYTMRSPLFLNYILTFSNRTNLPKVNKQQVEGFTCPMPDIELQNQFAAYVKQVDKLKAEEQNRLSKLQILFDRLMQKYFD